MHRFNTEAIIIKNINYSDSHKIYTLITPDHGIITAMARGVRKITSKRGGNLDTFNKVILNLTEDSKGFRSINEVKVLKSYRSIKNDFYLVSSSFYVFDIVKSVLEREHENRQVYNLLANFLDGLDSPDPKVNLLIGHFELHLAKTLGFEMMLDKCFVCLSKFSLDWPSLYLDVQNGGLLCNKCGPGGAKIGSDYLDLLNIIYQGTPFLDTKRYSNITDLTTNMLHEYVEYTLWDSLRYSKSAKMLFENSQLC